MRAVLSTQIAGTGVGEAALQRAPEGERVRRTLVLVLIGLAAYALALVALMPARVVLSSAGLPAGWASPTGTVWDGALIGPGGLTVAWRISPLRSIGRLAAAGDVTIRGPATSLTGEADWRPGRVRLEDLAGQAGWPLVRALAPDLPFACETVLDVDMDEVVLAGARSGAEGRIRSAPGACTAPGGLVTAAPALQAVATRDDTAARLRLAPLGRPSTMLAEVSLTPAGRVTARVTPAGAAVLPFAGPVALETEL